MAFTLHNASQGRNQGGRKRHASGFCEINVTPLVDVMLVLLIIFMVTAPLLTVGVPVDLPKTNASAMDEKTEPLTITVDAKGILYLQETPKAAPFANADFGRLVFYFGATCCACGRSLSETL